MNLLTASNACASTTSFLVFAMTLPADAHAQDPDRLAITAASLDTLGASVASFSPKSGPPGTVVELRVRDMPALEPLRIGVGALHMGFEESGWVMSNDHGEFTTDVTIPEWGRNDAVHVFIVFDPYFNPIALSDVFHVTDAENTIVRTGRVSLDGAGCSVLQGDDNIEYGIAGELADLRTGDHVEVRGTIAAPTTCAQRTVIRVITHHPADGRTPDP